MKNKKKTKSSKKTKLVIPNKEVTSLRPDMVLIEPNDRERNYNANNLMDVWLVIRILTLVIGNLTLVLGLKSKVIRLLTLIMFIKTLVESIQALVMGHGYIYKGSESWLPNLPPPPMTPEKKKNKMNNPSHTLLTLNL